MLAPSVLPVVTSASAALNTVPAAMFGDASGSMQTRQDDHPNRMDRMLHLLQLLQIDDLVLWSTKIELRTASARKVITFKDSDGYSKYTINGHPCKPWLGTSPSCVNSVPVAQQLLVFCTDGEIDAAELTRFATGFQHSASMVLCVLVGDAMPPRDMSSLNLSVVAPFMSGPHLALYCCGRDIYVIGGSDVVVPLLTEPLTSFPVFDPTSSLNMSGPTPEGYLRVGNMYVCADVSRITYEELLMVNVPALILRLKTNNTLQGLRSRLNIIIREATATPVDVLAVNNDDLMARIMACTDDAERAVLRAELVATRQTVSAARPATNNVVRDCNDWLQLMHEAERADYSASAVSSLLSNRVLRANMSVCQEEWNYANSMVAKCPICMERDTMTLLVLKSVSSSSSSAFDTATGFLSDWCLNFPLSMTQCVFSPVPLCLACANSRTRSMTDVYHNPILGYLPLVDIGLNYRRYQHELNMLLGQGRVAPHLFLCLLAIVTYAQSMPWAQSKPVPTMLSWLATQLLRHGTARDGLLDATSQSPVVPMERALTTVITSESAATRQPLMAYMCVMANMPWLKVNPYAVRYLARTFIRYTVEMWRHMLRGDRQRNLTILRREFFEEPHGIPQRNMRKVMKLEKSVVLNMLSHDMNYILYMLSKLGVVITPNFVTTLLTTLSQLEHDDSADQLILRLNKMAEFRQLWADSHLVDNQCIDTGATPPLLSLLSRPIVELDAAHARQPPFVTPFGTSRFRCSCGTVFATHDLLLTHMDAVYGMRHPGENTAHTTLHLTIREIMGQPVTGFVAAWATTETAVTRRLVIQVMARMRRAKGNIYSERLIHDVVAVLHTYFRALSLFPYATLDTSSTESGAVEQQMEDLENDNPLLCDYSIVYPADDDPLLAPFTEEEMVYYRSL